MATFNYGVAQGASKDITPRVLSAKFGDGYEQRVGDGINIRPRMWSITLQSKSVATINAAEAFLEARADLGNEAFNWTPPSGAAGVWVCKSWRRSDDTYSTSTLTATFEEVFGESPAA